MKCLHLYLGQHTSEEQRIYLDKFSVVKDLKANLLLCYIVKNETMSLMFLYTLLFDFSC